MATSFWDNSLARLTTLPGSGIAIQHTVIGPGTDGATFMANEWDSAILQGKQVPGLVDVRVPSMQRRVQNKKENGSDGSTPTFRGREPAKVNITVTIWTPDQHAHWDALLPIIFPNPNKDVNRLSALDISHPVTNQRGVKAIIIEDIDGPNPGQLHGSKMYSLRCVQYLPASKKKATKTVVAASATIDQFAPPVAGKNNPPPPSQTQSFQPTQSLPPESGSS